MTENKDLLRPEAAAVLEEFISKHYISSADRTYIAKDVASRCVRMWSQGELSEGVFAFLREPAEVKDD